MGEEFIHDGSDLYVRNGDEYALILPRALVRVVASSIDGMKKYRHIKEKRERNMKRIESMRCVTDSRLQIELSEKEAVKDLESKALKQALYSYCCGTDKVDDSTYSEENILPIYLPVWETFKRVNFCLDQFMSLKEYEKIEDEEVRVEVLMAVCFPLCQQPISRFMIDWLNGYLDFYEVASDAKESWKEKSETEILQTLYDCDSEQDIWKLLSEGLGDMPALYHWYRGEDFSPALQEIVPCYNERDLVKAREMLDYLLDPSTNTVESVRRQAEELTSFVIRF